MKLNKLFQKITRLLSVPFCLVLVGTLISSTESRRNGLVDKIIVDIKPLEKNIMLLNNDDLANDLKKSLKEKIKGQSIEELDLTEIEKVIESNVFVKDAQVYIDARNTLMILVQQKKPVVRVLNKEGESFYIDDEGNKIPLSQKAIVRLPVMTGEIGSYKKKLSTDPKSNYFNGFNVVKEVHNDPFVLALTEQIVIDAAGQVSIIPKIGNHKIILGGSDDLASKFRKLEVFYKKGMPANGWHVFSEINLKYKNQVVAKRAPQTEIKN